MAAAYSMDLRSRVLRDSDAGLSSKQLAERVLSHDSAEQTSAVCCSVVEDITFTRVVLGALAGWLSRRQQEAIAYLIEENRILLGAVAWVATPADGRGTA